MITKTSKTYLKILTLKDIILTGKILSVDPSTGSASSQPGFAWFDKGQLIESGELPVDPRDERHIRLAEISRTIREDFEQPDLLIVEYIPPVRYGSKGMNNISLMALQKAIGAIMGARPIPYMLEIPAVTWKNYKPKDYKKSDEHDSVAMGICAITVARDILKNEK